MNVCGAENSAKEELMYVMYAYSCSCTVNIAHAFVGTACVTIEIQIAQFSRQIKHISLVYCLLCYALYTVFPFYLNT